MRNGIELLHACESTLADVCLCGRGRCKVCLLRREVQSYLDVADPLRSQGRQGLPQPTTPEKTGPERPKETT